MYTKVRNCTLYAEIEQLVKIFALVFKPFKNFLRNVNKFRDQIKKTVL